MKVHELTGGQMSHMIFCPGCKCGHGFNVVPNKDNGRGGFEPVWEFNGDMDKPTIRASLLTWGVKEPPHDPNTGDFAKDDEGKYILDVGGRLAGSKNWVCHSFITDGKIQFLDDCTHELKGQTVDLEDF